MSSPSLLALEKNKDWLQYQRAKYTSHQDQPSLIHGRSEALRQYNDNNLKILLEVVREYSEDVRMGFGLDKCNKLTIKYGKAVPSNDMILTNNENIKALYDTEGYKYLGMVENLFLIHI